MTSSGGSGPDDVSRMDRVVDTLLDRLLRTGIDGVGKLDSARQVAANAQRSERSPEAAIDSIVSGHTKLAATGGFVTGLVALPANVVGFYVIATRMVAAIAAVRGYDVRRDEVRTAVLLALSGDDATEILRKAGGGVITGRATSFALDRLPPAALMAVNKGVAFRIVVQLGEKSLGRLGRMVPLAGGVIGGSIDAYFMQRLAKHARKEFPQQIGEITSA